MIKIYLMVIDNVLEVHINFFCLCYVFVCVGRRVLKRKVEFHIFRM